MMSNKKLKFEKSNILKEDTINFIMTGSLRFKEDANNFYIIR